MFLITHASIIKDNCIDLVHSFLQILRLKLRICVYFDVKFYLKDRMWINTFSIFMNWNRGTEKFSNPDLTKPFTYDA